MNISALGSSTAIANATLKYGELTSTSELRPGGGAATPTPAEIKKAAAQFEAILVRQLLSPSLQSIMKNNLGGEGSSSGGADTYSYMLTDCMADSVTQGGGLGLARILEKQFTPKSPTLPVSHVLHSPTSS